MKAFLKIFLLFIAVFIFNFIHAQDYFFRKDTLNVFDKMNNLLQKPWVGGFNHVQVSDVDLNLDGINDLIVFDRAGNKISTFINQGLVNSLGYSFAPQYKDSLPLLHDWVLFRDYNCDGKKDIFTYSSGGAAVYKNISNDKLEFELVTNLIYSDFLPDDTLNNPINLYISSVDIPAIDDIDGDGDMDIITFSILGTYAEYHKNLSVETYGTCDSLKYKLSNKCWGYFAENLADNSVTLNDTCSGNISNPQRQAIINQLIQEEYGSLDENLKKHSGSSLFTIDLDGNGTKELVLGDISFNNLTALYNGDITPTFTSANMISQDVVFPANNASTVAVDIDIFPSCFYVDVNNDTIKDLIVANNCYSGCENSKSLWLYLNNGTNNFPQFVFQKNNFLQEEMIELGERAFPVFFDYDEDGLMDVIISNYGKYDKSTSLLYKSSLHLFHNVGTSTQPVFKLIDDDFAGLSTINLDLIGNKPVLGIYPAFGDLNGDGVKDMVVGDYFGNLHYFVNNASSGNPANFVLNQPKFSSIDVGNYATPQLIDLNRDGKIDLVVGKENGYFSYFQNNGTVSAPVFTKITDSLGYVNTKHPMFFKSNSIPCIIDVNGSYVMYAGSSSGNIFKFGNIDGNLSGTFSKLDTNFLKINEGVNSSISMANINNDAYIDLLIGNQAGGVAYFEGGEPIISVQELVQLQKVTIYPNPSSGIIVIDIASNNLENAMIEVFDLLGKRIYHSHIYNSTSNHNLTWLKQGIYIVKFSNRLGNSTIKWIKK